jgi:methylenetetrahydrofolate--tRNA-(uracil-5-)-methyltransferase
MEITVVGGGLAGVEAACQIARMGGKAILYEMRPEVNTPAHSSDFLGELVCSNSLKSMDLSNAHGLLKEELRILGSVIVKAADETKIPGGKALVVDRERFASRVTAIVEENPNIHVVRKEVREIPGGCTVIASGPLTSDTFAEKLKQLTLSGNLFFFDAISPIIDAGSIDYNDAFYASRYDKDGSGDYLNCPLSAEEYDLFHEELVNAERVELKHFEKTSYFEGCLPVEVIAERGKRTLAFGPMKPVGLTDPRTGRRPYAVLQLRKENSEGTLFNLVGFQTKMKYSEQERVFRLIPALKHAQFMRYGSIHRNTYINAPSCLNDKLQSKVDDRIFFAGQLTGVEGYMESTAMGLIAGLSAFMHSLGHEFYPPLPTTCIGSLIRYLTTENKHFQPMNINFGIVDGYSKKTKEATVLKSLEDIDTWKKEIFPASILEKTPSTC